MQIMQFFLIDIIGLLDFTGESLIPAAQTLVCPATLIEPSSLHPASSVTIETARKFARYLSQQPENI
jgi:hypothetical protein